MRIIQRARAMGKTHEAVKLANETGAYLVVRDMREAQRINQQYKLNRFPVTFSELEDKQMIRGSFVRNFVIDNGDDWVRWHFERQGAKIEAITITAVEPHKEG